MTLLCELANKYKTDKCPEIKHPYTPFYYEIFKDRRNDIKKVFELGIGLGGSLRMWRDFFPLAQVYGSDIREDRLFGEERIKTFQANENSFAEWEHLLKEMGVDIDLFVDDGLHHPHYQVKVCKFLMPLFSKEVVYIIEDVKEPEQVVKALPDYDCFVPPLQSNYPDRLVVVRHKMV